MTEQKGGAKTKKGLVLLFELKISFINQLCLMSFAYCVWVFEDTPASRLKLTKMKQAI